MKDIHIYVGEMVDKIRFSSGVKPWAVNQGEVCLSMIHDTGRHVDDLPTRVSKTRFAESFICDLAYCIKNWNYHIATHRNLVLNTIGDLIEYKMIDHEKVFIHMLDEQNNLVKTTGFTEDGYLKDWIDGFMQGHYNVRQFKEKVDRL